MSDTFDISQLVAANDARNAALTDVVDTSGLSDLPTVPAAGAPSWLTPSTSSGAGAPLVPPVLNLPTTGNTGFTGLLNDLTSLVTSVYKGEAQVEAAKSATDIARARSGVTLQNIKTAPTIWTVLGLGAGALVLLELVKSGRGK
jgi:hypothetical protein